MARTTARMLTLGVLASASFFAASGSAFARIIIQVRYDYVGMEISPTQQYHRSHEGTSIAIEGKSISNPDNQRSTDGTFGRGGGGGGINRAGLGYTTTYGIRNGKFIKRLTFPGHDILYTIATDGNQSCTAAIQILRKPGHPYFEDFRISDHALMYFSDLHAENVQCVISG